MLLINEKKSLKYQITLNHRKWNVCPNNIVQMEEVGLKPGYTYPERYIRVIRKICDL